MKTNATSPPQYHIIAAKVKIIKQQLTNWFPRLRWPFIKGSEQSLLVWACILYGLAAVGAAVQSWGLAQTSTNTINGAPFHEYNNYVIFKQSFHHLMSRADLYQSWPAEHWDLFKYTPTFALFFGVFALFPDLWGLMGWNLLNAAVLAGGLFYLKTGSRRERALGMMFLWPELLISLQNEQSNALIAGLLLLALGGLERGQQMRPALWIMCSVFIKLFGVMALALVPCYKRWRLILLKAIVIGFILATAPILLVSTHYYWAMILSYIDMLAHDHAVSYGMSVMGWLQAWFGPMMSIEFPKTSVLLVGLMMLIMPFAWVWVIQMRKQGLMGTWWQEGLHSSQAFRGLWLSSLMIWMVIFNHKAESPTFIIALSGILLAYINGPRSGWDRFLLMACWILSSWSPTDVFPSTLRKVWIEPYQLKVFPCILYWMRVVWLMTNTARFYNSEAPVSVNQKEGQHFT